MAHIMFGIDLHEIIILVAIVFATLVMYYELKKHLTLEQYKFESSILAQTLIDARKTETGSAIAEAIALQRKLKLTILAADELPVGLQVILESGETLLWNKAAIDLVGPMEGGPETYDDSFSPKGMDDKPIPYGEVPISRALRGETIRQKLKVHGKIIEVRAKPLNGSAAVCVFWEALND